MSTSKNRILSTYDVYAGSPKLGIVPASSPEQVGGDWGVAIYSDTLIDTMEAEALVNRELHLFPSDVAGHAPWAKSNYKLDRRKDFLNAR